MMPSGKVARAGWAVGLLTGLVACGGGSGNVGAGSDGGAPAGTATTTSSNLGGSVRVNATPTVLAVGETATWVASALDATGAALPNVVPTWSSSDTTIADVSPSGLVTAHRQGTVTLTAAVAAAQTSVALEVAWAVADVDFSGSTRVTLATGLLHGFSFGAPSSAPPDSSILPLGIGYWRSIPGVVPPLSAKRVGARYDVVLSDLWGYPSDGWPHGAPWLNLAAYGAFIAQAARQLQGSVDYWEIWNEPGSNDDASFWNGTEAQFFDTYLTAYRALRSVLGPDALIVGPSIAKYDPAYLDRFAAYCITNHCEANVLAWHEPDVPDPDLATRASDARMRYGPKSVNSALNVRQIHVNEYDGSAVTHKPVDSLLYLRYFEQVGVDAVARACWTDSTGEGECYNNSLGGLIVSRTQKPRSVWHAYRLYAQGVAGRVSSRTSQAPLLSLASITTGGSTASPSTMAAQVLIGASSDATVPASPRIGVRLHAISSIGSLAGKLQISMQLLRLSNSEETPSGGPVLVSRQSLNVTGDVASATIAADEAGALYQVVLSP